MSRWGKANRPKGGPWTGMAHQATCPSLALRGGTPGQADIRALHPTPPGRPPQTGICCGGDEKRYRTLVPAMTEAGCPSWAAWSPTLRTAGAMTTARLLSGAPDGADGPR
jgi:hypothetical protein